MKVELRKTPNAEYYNKLNNSEKAQVNKFFLEIESNWGKEQLTNFIYAIAKDEKLSDDENKKRQREFFKHIYYMLVDKDTGPRLPTLLLAIGLGKVKQLSTFIWRAKPSKK